MDDSHGSAAPPPAVPARPGDATVLSAKPEDAALASATVNEIGRALEGRVLGPYRLDEFVGGGGMGAVFRALDTTLDRRVAVKVLSRQHSGDAEMLRRFKVEAQSAARLDHQNIGRVYNVGSEDGWHYIVFEFIDGTNLRDVVARGGPLDVPSTLRFTVQLAAALEHAADRDVVHRDIKPSNIIITPEGRARIVDMGLARRHRLADDDELTQSGMTLGTFDYISPEQARDPRAADVRSDLYSLGCTVYFMLAGRPPFAEGTLVQKLLHHQQNRAVAIESLRPDVPRGLAAAVQRLMEKDPADRYQNPAELIADLVPVAEECDIDITAGRPGGAVEAVPISVTASPSRLPWLVPLVGLGCVVAGLLASSARQRTLPEAGPDAAGAALQPSAVRPVPAGTPWRVVAEPTGLLERRTVAEALAEAIDGDVIELAFDGPRDEPSWNLVGRRLTVRAAAGHAPVVRFAGRADGEPVRRAACRIDAGGLTIERVMIVLEGSGGALFALGPAGGLTFEQTTIELPLDSGGPSVAGAASGAADEMTAVVRFTGIDGRSEGSDQPPPSQIRFLRSRVTGAGSLLEAAGAGTVDCEWQEGDCDLDGRFVVAEGSRRGSGPGVIVRLVLGSATFDCDDGFAWLLDSPARPLQPQLRAVVDGCRFRVPEGRALIEQSGIDAPAAYRSSVEWSDTGGRYEGSTVWRRIDGAAERIDLDYASSPRPLVHVPAVSRGAVDR
jgi:hypothetical protein